MKDLFKKFRLKMDGKYTYCTNTTRKQVKKAFRRLTKKEIEKEILEYYEN